MWGWQLLGGIESMKTIALYLKRMNWVVPILFEKQGWKELDLTDTTAPWLKYITLQAISSVARHQDERLLTYMSWLAKVERSANEVTFETKRTKRKGCMYVSSAQRFAILLNSSDVKSGWNAAQEVSHWRNSKTSTLPHVENDHRLLVWG